MKKLLSLLVCLTMILTLSACSSGKAEKPAAPKAAPTSAAGKPAAPQKKILVAYFSASGNTKAVANRIAQAASADILEITPAQPYTREDLDYHIENCRANKEQHDAKARPAIAAKLDKVGQYDTVIIGYPIWWGIEPRIIDTFIERTRLDGKNVAVFATSGGSGIEGSVKSIKALCPKANWKGAKLFSSGASAQELQDWLASMGIK